MFPLVKLKVKSQKLKINILNLILKFWTFDFGLWIYAILIYQLKNKAKVLYFYYNKIN